VFSPLFRFFQRFNTCRFQRSRPRSEPCFDVGDFFVREIVFLRVPFQPIRPQGGIFVAQQSDTAFFCHKSSPLSGQKKSAFCRAKLSTKSAIRHTHKSPRQSNRFHENQGRSHSSCPKMFRKNGTRCEHSDCNGNDGCAGFSPYFPHLTPAGGVHRYSV